MFVTKQLTEFCTQQESVSRRLVVISFLPSCLVNMGVEIGLNSVHVTHRH